MLAVGCALPLDTTYDDGDRLVDRACGDDVRFHLVIPDCLSDCACADDDSRPATKSPSPAPSPAPLSSPSARQWIVFAACGANEALPASPEVPADLFTSCLTTPIKTALNWFIQVSWSLSELGDSRSWWSCCCFYTSSSSSFSCHYHCSSCHYHCSSSCHHCRCCRFCYYRCYYCGDRC